MMAMSITYAALFVLIVPTNSGLTAFVGIIEHKKEETHMTIQQKRAMLRARNAATEIIATFRDGRTVRYTTAVLRMLETDPDVETIVSAVTGEILYTA